MHKELRQLASGFAVASELELDLSNRRCLEAWGYVADAKTPSTAGTTHP